MPNIPNSQINAVISAVKNTGKFIQEEAKHFSKQDVDYKGWNDLVTYVDQQSEAKLVEALRGILPEAGILAEEAHTELETGKDYQWIIDPLDGTLNFVHRLPMYAISVALMKDRELQLGVVYEPNLDECFHAVKGAGAYLNNEPIKVSPTETLENALFATGFPIIDPTTVAHYTRILNHLLTHSRGVRRFGSAAMDLCYTATGRFDAYYEYGLKPWDVAAGALIMEEAGGQVTDFQGGANYLFGKEIVAGNPELCKTFLSLHQQQH